MTQLMSYAQYTWSNFLNLPVFLHITSYLSGLVQDVLYSYSIKGEYKCFHGIQHKRCKQKMLSHQLRFRHYYLSCRILSTVNIERWPSKPLFPFPFRVIVVVKLSKLSVFSKSLQPSIKRIKCKRKLFMFCLVTALLCLPMNCVGFLK